MIFPLNCLTYVARVLPWNAYAAAMVRDRATARVMAATRVVPGTEATTDTRDGETMTVVTFSALVPAVPARVATAVHLRAEASPAPRTTVSRPMGASAPKQTLKPEETRVGDRVRHATLGEGVIIGLEGAGERTIAEVAFASAKKRLLLRMAPMEKI